MGLGPYVAIGDGEQTLGTLADVLSGDDEPLASGRPFAWFEKHAPAADVRLMFDIRELLPIRPTIGGGPSPLAPLLAGHLLHVVNVAPLLVGSLTLKEGVHAVLEAPSLPLPAEYGFCAPAGPAPAVLSGPEDMVFRVSLRRNVWSWWTRPPEFSPKEQTAALERWKARFADRFPDVSLDAIVRGLGDTFDIYGRAGAASGQEDVDLALALVATVRNPRVLEPIVQLLLAGLGPRVASGTGSAPVLEVRSHREIPIQCVVVPGEAPGEQGLERGVPCAAIVGDRLIVSSDLPLLRLLATQVLDGATRPREAGDQLVVHGSALSRLLEQEAGSVPIPRGIPDLDPARVRALLERLGGFLRGAGQLRVNIHVTDDLARLTLDADVPGWPSAPAPGPQAPPAEGDGG